MKIKNLLLVFFATLAFASCKKDLQTEVTEVIPASKATLDKGKAVVSAVQLPPVTPSPGTFPIYRLLNPFNGKHFLCGPEEATILINTYVEPGSGFRLWVFDKLVGFAFGSSSGVQGSGAVQPLYRYYKNDGDHYYSNSSTPPQYYVSEGTLGFIATTPGPSKRPLYSFYKKRGTFDRFYTTDFNEIGNDNADWASEGVIGYIF